MTRIDRLGRSTFDLFAMLTPAQKVEARRRRAQGATLAELARRYDVGKSTISRLTA
jgi:DNA-binding MurR/RpiR family transcriptional regulator